MMQPTYHHRESHSSCDCHMTSCVCVCVCVCCSDNEEGEGGREGDGESELVRMLQGDLGEAETEVPRINVEIPRCSANLGTDQYFVKLPNFLSVETRSVCVCVCACVCVCVRACVRACV